MTMSDKLYKILIQGGSWKTILGGLWVTIQISVFGCYWVRYWERSSACCERGKTRWREALLRRTSPFCGAHRC